MPHTPPAEIFVGDLVGYLISQGSEPVLSDGRCCSRHLSYSNGQGTFFILMGLSVPRGRHDKL